MILDQDKQPSLSVSQRLQRKRTGRMRDKYFESVTNSSEKYSILKRIKTSKVQFSMHSGVGPGFADKKPSIIKNQSTNFIGADQPQGVMQMATLSASEHISKDNIRQRNMILMNLKQTPSLHNQVDIISGHNERKSSHDIERIRDSARRA